MKSEYKIRDGTAADIPAINGLFNAAVLEDILDWNKPRPMEFHTEWSSRLNGYPFVVVTNGEEDVLAYGALEPQSTAEGSSFMFNTNLRIVVKADHRRQGIATAIWKALCAHQATFDKSIYMVICIVLSINEAALGFAKAINFNLDGTIEKMAVKKQQFCDQVWHSCFVGSSPSVQGLGFPDDELYTASPAPSHRSVSLDSTGFAIRDAMMADLRFLTDIYNDVILSSTALEFWLPKTEDERRQWLQRLLDEKYPILIAEEDDEPLGYVSLTPWNDHPDQCYKHTAHISAYVVKDLKKRRIGETLYKALTKHRYVAERQIFTVVADVTATNGAAYSGCLKAGFKKVVDQNRVLIKFGEAFSMVWFQREFGPQPDLQETIEAEEQTPSKIADQ